MGQGRRQCHHHSDAIRAAIQRIESCDGEGASGTPWDQPQDGGEMEERTFVHDAPMGPKDPRSTVLTVEDEAIAVAFRKHTLLPLDDCRLCPAGH